jgi:uncharacterized protein YihD (DUF1040 family)
MLKLHKFFWCLFPFAIGVLLGYMSTQFRLFSIKYEIDIIPAFFSILTILIGVYIAVVIQKNISDKRVQKDIFIERLEELKEAANKIDEEINSNRRFDELNMMYKHFSSKLSTLETLLKHARISGFNSDLANLKANLLDFKQVATGATKSNNVYTYSPNDLLKLNSTRLEILEKVDIFILDINTI